MDTVGAIFEWIWAHGRAADTAEALEPLAASLGIADSRAALGAPDVKTRPDMFAEGEMARLGELPVGISRF
ncbi:hypothetical protein [Luteibacter sp.]|uniref:hypothetical protein n=1 Tax=Luteibacter sp. TaxID=1886636 RepID=UPI002F3EB0F1